jgi:hypothetical protein
MIGGTLLVIGYILSPASWWNDALINIPIAYVVALLFSQISHTLFSPVMVIAYWGTNFIGFLMMYVGGVILLRKDMPIKAFQWRRMITISTVYTLVIVILMKIGILTNPF